MAANIRCIMRAKANYGAGLSKLKVNLTPTQSGTPWQDDTVNNAPYVFRSVPEGNREFLRKLVGGTVAWNQLCNSSSVTGTSGHKFYLKKSGAESITNTNTFMGLASGTDMVTDLTQMFGSTIADYVYSLEQSQAGSGIQWLKDYDLIDDQYHAYSQGSLESVNVSAHKMVGFNQWDGTYTNGKWINSYTTGEVGNANSSYNVTDFIRVLPNTDYYMHETGSSRNIFYDANKNAIPLSSWSISNTAKVITSPANAAYIRFTITNAYLSEFCLNISNAEKNGTYEAYWSEIYPTDSTLTLRGILKTDANGNLYYDGDEYLPDGTVNRYYGERAYQAGDESLTDAITDGTNTVYKLTTPTTESADPFTNPQVCDPDGTEEWTDYGVEQGTRDYAVPVGHESTYAMAYPIEGVDSFTVTANDGTSHTYPVTLSEEIYRGYVDMLTGEAVSDMASIAEYNGETINAPWLSSLDVYALGATPTKGAQVVYPIAPEEVTATITGDPSTLSGVVSVTSTEGTVEWGELSEIGIKCIMKRKNPFQ